MHYPQDVSSNPGSSTGGSGASKALVIPLGLCLALEEINIYSLAESFQLPLISQFRHHD